MTTKKRKPAKAEKQTGPGRPKAEIDPAQVELLVKIGCTIAEIAAVLNVNKKTLERRFADTIDNSRLKRNASLRRMQWQKALSGNVAMQIWLGKNMLGQSDRTQLTGKDDGPIQTETAVAKLTDEQLDAEIAKEIKRLGLDRKANGLSGKSDGGAAEEG